MSAPEAVRLRPMTLADLPAVQAIDRLSFPAPWTENMYRYELEQNAAGHFFVGELAGEVVCYAGYWMLLDEAHLGTIAVRPDQRGRGLGRRLLLAVMQHAVRMDASLVTLEVRVSNQAAQAMYRRQAFEEVGRRRHYYRDNGEDALIFTLRLDDAARERLRAQAADPIEEVS